MKLLIYAPANSVHSKRWVNKLVDEGHEVTWLSLNNNIFKRTDKYEVYSLGFLPRYVSAMLGCLIALWLIKKKKPDLVHIHSLGSHMLLALLPIRVPIVATAWGSDMIFGLKQWWRRVIIKAVVKNATILSCDSPHMVDRFIACGASCEKIRMINFGVDCDLFKPGAAQFKVPNSDATSHYFRIISLRNHEPIYNLSTLLRASREVAKKRQDFRVKIFGQGSETELLKKLVKELDVESFVSFEGIVSEGEVYRNICNSDVMVSTSLSDAGLASSCAEAMACGVPVILVDVYDNGFWTQHRKTAIHFRGGDYLSLANEILFLMKNRKIARTIGMAGRRQILKTHNLDIEIKTMQGVYESIF